MPGTVTSPGPLLLVEIGYTLCHIGVCLWGEKQPERAGRGGATGFAVFE